MDSSPVLLIGSLINNDSSSFDDASFVIFVKVVIALGWPSNFNVIFCTQTDV